MKIDQSLLTSVGFAALGAALSIWGVVSAVLDSVGSEGPIIIRIGENLEVAATGSVVELGLFGGFLSLLLIMNIFLVLQLERRDWLWGKVLSFATLLMGALIFWAFQGIVSFN